MGSPQTATGKKGVVKLSRSATETGSSFGFIETDIGAPSSKLHSGSDFELMTIRLMLSGRGSRDTIFKPPLTLHSRLARQPFMNGETLETMPALWASSGKGKGQ